MIPTLWFLTAALVWVLGSGRPLRGAYPGARQLFAGSVGVGLTCFALGVLSHGGWERMRPYMAGLVWGSVLLSVPIWTAFSSRFGRSRTASNRGTEAVVSLMLWLSAAGLLVIGLRLPPIAVEDAPQAAGVIRLQGTLGRVLVLHALVGMAIVFRNLQATQEAARLAGRRKLARAIYALLPALLVAFYLMAEMLLYGEQRLMVAVILIPAIFLASGISIVVLGRGWREELSVPVDHPIVHSQAIVVALGLFLIGLAVVSNLFRGLAGPQVIWYEGGTAFLLALFLSIWTFPGLRSAVQDFLNGHVYPPSFSHHGAAERIENALRGGRDPASLVEDLRAAFRAAFGPVHMALWISEPSGEEWRPVGNGEEPVLRVSHPLVRALAGRARPLVVAGEAGRVEDVPLHVACELLRDQHGLRIFYPILKEGKLVGTLGCGPGGGRTFHPEDLEIFRSVSARLGEILDPDAGLDPASDKMVGIRV